METSIYLNALSESYCKFLDRLKTELMAYSREKIMWETKDTISNSAGNLAVHVLGNLNHFLGAVLGETGYLRDRPLEFSVKYKPRTEILEEIDKTRQMLASIIPNLSEESLNADFPLKVGDEIPSTHQWLIRCNTHLAYHLGQINYHRRLLDSI